jgi:murein DD-endopeptidase MepM/ murein hydrolase activator NlpD
LAAGLLCWAVGHPSRKIKLLPSSFRKLVLAGLSVAVLSACASSPKAEPSWENAAQGRQATPTVEAPTGEAAAPAPTTSPATSAPATAAVKPKAAQAVKVTYTFPVIGKSSYAHTHHDYQATDVMTACGHTFVAVTSGVVLTVSKKDTWSAKVNAGATRGGLSVSILGDDGVRYYGSHLSAVGTNINPGVRVKTGQTLGKTGDTGDASACHLHFGISPPCAKVGDWWNQRGTLYPWPYLDSWRAKGQKSAVAAVKAWQKKNGCPKKPTVDK